MTAPTGGPVPAQHAKNAAVPECPYVGLVPFNEENAAYFFGRKDESDLIVANLTASRLTLLYAHSGVGKSSVLRAGVLPRLAQFDDDCFDDLGIPGAAVAYVSAWRDAPLESIAAAVTDAVSRVPGANAVAETTGVPRFSAHWLREVLRQSRVSTVYLILDQFEEYLLYHTADRGEEGLPAELGSILSARDLPVHVLLSIREDALASLDRFKGRVPHLFDNYLRLTHLSRTAAEAAIEGPLAHYNTVAPPELRMSIEPGLITTLLDQVRTGQVRVAADGPASGDRGDIETPFLQLVLKRLWDTERDTGSSRLRRSTLDGLGGAEKIVQSHLDTVMDELSPPQRAVAAAVFGDLVRPSGAKIALSAQDLADRGEQPVSAVADLLEMLCSGPQRILRPLPPAAGVVGPPRYEIFHDVMGPAVLDWRRRYVAQQERDELSRRLDAERAEVRAAARTARRRLLRRFAVVLAVALLVAVVSGVAAVYYNRKAQQQTKLAQAAAAMGYNPVQSLQSAAEAYQLDANEEAQEAVLRVASSPRSRVVAGPRPVVAGMVATPDLRHAVAFDALGGIRVIGADDAVKREVTASGLPGAVQVADVNPDASRVVLATDQGTAAVIDTATGARITEIHLADRATPKVLSWIGDATNGLVFLVSGSGRAATYNPETGHQVVSFPEAFEFLSLAREQHIVTSSEKDRKLRVWDARTATVIAESSTLAAFPQYLRRYGQSVVGLSLDENSSIVVWNGQAGSDPVQYRFDYTEHVQQVFVDEQAGTISIATDQGMATYSLTGSRQGVLHQWAGRINDVATSPDGRWLTTAGADGRVLVHFLEHQSYPNRPTYELLAHHGPVTQVKYLHGGTVVMSLGIDGTVRRWELPPVPRFEHHAGGVVDMDSSRDGSLLATASVDGGAFVMDRRDLSKVRATRSNAGLVSLRFDPTNPHCVLTLVQYSTTPELWRWDGGNQECTQTYAEPPLSATDNLVSLAVSPDGLIVAGADTRGTIHLWDARTGTLRPDQYSLGPGWPYYAIAFDPASRLIAATGPDKVRVWNLGNTTPLHTLPHPNVTGVAFDPSGQQLISTAQDGTVYIWTIPGGTLDQKLVAHGHPSSNPAFSTDGRLFAVGSAEGLVEVWNVHSGRTVMLDRHHSDSVRSVIFPPDRSAGLISASDDTTVAQFPCLACSDPDRATREAVEWARAN